MSTQGLMFKQRETVQISIIRNSRKVGNNPNAHQLIDGELQRNQILAHTATRGTSRPYAATPDTKGHMYDFGNRPQMANLYRQKQIS